MSEVRRIMYAQTVSSATVTLVRFPGLESLAGGDPSIGLRRITVETGQAAADVNANTSFWAANCTRYEVVIRRLT